MKRQFYCLPKFLIPFIFFLLALPSCIYKYLGPEEPMIINRQSCIPMNEDVLQFHAFVAIVRAIDARKWVFSIINQKEYKVVAWVGGRRYPTEICVRVDPNGLLTITRTDANNLWRDHYRWVRRWMANLERSFNKYRCETLESLLPKVKKFGIKK